MSPILTIFIPSYNRGRRVRALVAHLLPCVEAFNGRIELIVSNNKSTDGTEALLNGCSSPFFSLINREVHLTTAEEHMFQSVELCNGKYVWFLGDDDIPQLDTVESTVELLESGEHDYLVFNSINIDPTGCPTGSWVAPLDTALKQVDFTLGACALGYTFGLAGISNTIMLREPLLNVDWRKVIATQLIYSHVALWLQAFKGYRLTAVNKILVFYRLESSDKIGARFRNYAIKNELSDFYFWTSGLIDQLIYLEEVGAIAPKNIFNMFEQRGDGSYYRFLDNIVHLLWAQARLSVTEDEPRNRLSGASLERMTDWVLRIDPGYYECIGVIKDIHAMRPHPESDPLPLGYTESQYAANIKAVETPEKLLQLDNLFHTLENSKAGTNAFIDLVGRCMGYAIYRHITGFVAFDDKLQIERQTVLRRFELVSSTDAMLVADTEKELFELIKQVRKWSIKKARLDFVGPIQAELALLRSELMHISAATNPIIAKTSPLPASNAVQKKPKLSPLTMLKRVIGEKGKPRYFDTDFYLNEYKDVRESGFVAHEHYRLHGMKEGRSPNPMFDAPWYARNNHDVEDNGEAFKHFLAVGINEGRRPHPFHTAAEFASRYLK